MNEPTRLHDGTVVYSINDNMRLVLRPPDHIQLEVDPVCPSWLENQKVNKPWLWKDLLLLSAGIVLVALIWIGAVSL